MALLDYKPSIGGYQSLEGDHLDSMAEHYLVANWPRHPFLYFLARKILAVEHHYALFPLSFCNHQ
jgi:hypothetical protein